jgi:hypothetical protein
MLRDHIPRSVTDPVCDRKRAKLAEMPIIKAAGESGEASELASRETRTIIIKSVNFHDLDCSSQATLSTCRRRDSI